MESIPTCNHEDCSENGMKYIMRLDCKRPGAFETVWYCEPHFSDVFREAFLRVQEIRDDSR